MTMARGEPILIRCEGSQHPGHRVDWCSSMCAMCGQIVDHEPNSDVLQIHWRDDILARIERGDFDA